MKRLLTLLLAMALLLPACAAAAADPPAFAVTSPEGLSVSAFSKGSRLTLPIPGGWDVSRLVLTVRSRDSVRFGDTVLRSGETVDLTPWLGRTVPFRNAAGKQLGTITVLQGSAITSLHFAMNAEDFGKVGKSRTFRVLSGSLTAMDGEGHVTWQGGLTQFRLRGNETARKPKKPWQFKLTDKVPLAGMAAGRTWILLADYYDRSLLRNRIALGLCRAAGLPGSVDCEPVDLYVNGVYQGLYLLTEKIQVGRNRVNIRNLEEETEALNADVSAAPFFRETEGRLEYHGYDLPAEPEDCTGGYILCWEKPHRYSADSGSGFATGSGLYVVIKEPTYASRAQARYIAVYFNTFHHAVSQADGRDPVTGTYYADLIDLSSFARKYLIEEAVRNYDALGGSQFFFKDAGDAPLVAGPGWDYDLSLGNTGLSMRGKHLGNPKTSRNLWYVLALHEDFRQALKEAYTASLRPALLALLGEGEPVEGLRSIAEFVEEAQASAAMNNRLWPGTRISGINTNAGGDMISGAAYLERYIRGRLAWMDEIWGQP